MVCKMVCKMVCILNQIWCAQSANAPPLLIAGTPCCGTQRPPVQASALGVATQGQAPCSHCPALLSAGISQRHTLHTTPSFESWPIECSCSIHRWPLAGRAGTRSTLIAQTTATSQVCCLSKTKANRRSNKTIYNLHIILLPEIFESPLSFTI